jgi:hypothetical protein
MAGDKTRFTPAMRNATSSSQPPGGSTKILGRDAQCGSREVTANCVSPAPDLTPTSPDYDNDDDAARETEDFLAGLMHATYAQEDDG